MGMHAESSRFLVYELLDCMERGTATEEQGALVKASLSRAVPEVVMTGHQLHGGQGYIEENDLYFFTIRGKTGPSPGGPQKSASRSWLAASKRRRAGL